jgi:hypothetical protein
MRAWSSSAVGSRSNFKNTREMASDRLEPPLPSRKGCEPLYGQPWEPDGRTCGRRNQPCRASRCVDYFVRLGLWLTFFPFSSRIDSSDGPGGLPYLPHCLGPARVQDHLRLDSER